MHTRIYEAWLQARKELLIRLLKISRPCSKHKKIFTAKHRFHHFNRALIAVLTRIWFVLQAVIIKRQKTVFLLNTLLLNSC